MIKAVTAIINHPISGKFILGVSRKDNSNDFGLPGGKLDPGESWEDALIRETKEETGLIPVDFDCVFEKVETHKNVEYLTRTYYVYNVKDYNLHSTESGIVSWITWNKLIDDSSSFKEYNRSLRNHLIALSNLD